ncbi:MAG: hypothetical protein CM15mP49_30130 [Actinomycetota bacterium]|nr:MAG: hypothetical protein CM15mP49_30130 [Actinomycetota bacterium]
MPNKVLTEEEVVSEIQDGMTIGVGGWGSRRKPMSLIRAIIRAGRKDLTIVSYGGPEIGLLAATGQLRERSMGSYLWIQYRLNRTFGSLDKRGQSLRQNLMRGFLSRTTSGFPQSSLLSHALGWGRIC